jgi:hypothetical protein
VQSAPGDRLASYGQTIVEILLPERASVRVRATPGVDDRAWPWPTIQTVHILTAWDPGLQRPGLGHNRMRQAALQAELGRIGVPFWTAIGVDTGTRRREEGVAVVGLPEPDILALGARYGQDAVFAWAPAEWAIVACRDGRRLVSGWALCPPSSAGM